MARTIQSLVGMACFAAALTLGHAALSQEADSTLEPTAEQIAEFKRIEAAAATLQPEAGRVSLPEAKASLAVPEGYGFLDATEARTLLVDVWGNMPEDVTGVLGIIVRKDADMLAPETWGAVVTFEAAGYISDADAADLKPAELLKEMQDAEIAVNEERRAAGYPGLSVVGWAEPPHYEQATHRVYWARQLHADDVSDPAKDTLNYGIRVLGRYGYLSLNFVAGMDQLAAVKAAAPTVLGMAEFDEGARYSDHSAGDAVADYGLAGLVTGVAAAGVAKKAGLFALLAAFGKKAFVLLLALLGAGWTAIRRVLNGRKQEEEL